MRARRDFTFLICCPILLVLLPLLLWWLWNLFQVAPYDCNRDYVIWDVAWSEAKKNYCCETEGRGCPTQRTTAFPETTVTLPPTPPPTPTWTRGPTGDPHNCAIGRVEDWSLRKRRWCCRVHHKGCPGPVPTLGPTVGPTSPRPPPDPYNCAEGYSNWQVGWSIGKKAWCCKVHGKGCPATGCVTTSPPYDCDAGYANWMAGWSIGKKAWCCKNRGKGCPSGGGCA